MSKQSEFGIFLKELRLDADLSLRQFSELVSYDVSNLSKIERGLLPPPPGNLMLRKWLKELKINSSDTKYKRFLDLAAIQRTVFPDDLSERDLKEYLPAFYRTIRNKNTDEEQFNELVKLLKKS